MKKKALKEREELMRKKQKISMKTYNTFKFYPVIMCHGRKGTKSTLVNVNVGGQIFRMND